jgi:hypothetical protein
MGSRPTVTKKVVVSGVFVRFSYFKQEESAENQYFCSKKARLDSFEIVHAQC